MSAKDLLKDSLNELDFKLYRTRPSGNCFFSCMAKYLRMNGFCNQNLKKKGPINTGFVRESLIKYIQTNRFIINFIQQNAGMSKKDIEEDLYELRQSGVYDLDIFDLIPIIIATQYNINVCIFTWISSSSNMISYDDCEVYCPIGCSKKESKQLGKVHLLYTDLEHYDLLY